MSDAISRMRIEVPEEVLDDLRRRLAAARFPDQIPGSGWGYGTDGAYLRELCGYWRDKFDWRAQEALLNRFEHYHTSVDGQKLHFVHARSKLAGALPLVITHGWPGSVFEFHKIIGPLVDPVAHGGERTRRLPRRLPVDPRLRLLGPDARARLGRAPRGRDVREADGAARLHAIWSAGRRLGRDHHHAARARRSRARRGHPSQHGGGRRAAGRRESDGGRLRRGAEGARRHGRVRQERDGLPADPGHQAADARLRAERFAHRARRLDRREVPQLERLRRRRRKALQQGRAAHEHHDLLGHRDDQFVRASLLRDDALGSLRGVRPSA